MVMEEILEGTGWRVNQFIASPGAMCVAVIEKEK